MSVSLFGRHFVVIKGHNYLIIYNCRTRLKIMILKLHLTWMFQSYRKCCKYQWTRWQSETPPQRHLGTSFCHWHINCFNVIWIRLIPSWRRCSPLNWSRWKNLLLRNLFCLLDFENYILITVLINDTLNQSLFYWITVRTNHLLHLRTVV